MAAVTTAAQGRQPVFLLDFAVYKPHEELRVDREVSEERGKSWSVSRGCCCRAPLPRTASTN
jgi:hypothetical protein